MSSLLFPDHLLCRPWSYVVRCISTRLWRSLHGADPWRPPEAFLDLLCGPWTLPGTLASQRLSTALGWLEFLSVSVFLPCALTRFPPWTQAQTPTLPVSTFIWSFQWKFGRKEVRQMVFVVILNAEVLFLPTTAFPGMNVLSLLSLTSFLSPRLPRWMTSVYTRLHGRKFSSTASPHARAQKLCVWSWQTGLDSNQWRKRDPTRGWAPCVSMAGPSWLELRERRCPPPSRALLCSLYIPCPVSGGPRCLWPVFTSTAHASSGQTEQMSGAAPCHRSVHCQQQWIAF